MFETERLILRPLLEDDAKTLKRVLQQVDYARFTSSLALANVGDDVVEKLVKPREPHELPRYAICEKPQDYNVEQYVISDDAKPLPIKGIISFQNESFDYKNRGCNLGIGFHDPRDRGKGYGTEVLKWALDYGFYELGLHRIGLVTYSLNEPGIACYRKIGFIEEGRIRQTYFSAGKWYDSLMFGLLEEDWAKLKSK